MIRCDFRTKIARNKNAEMIKFLRKEYGQMLSNFRDENYYFLCEFREKIYISVYNCKFFMLIRRQDFKNIFHEY